MLETRTSPTTRAAGDTIRAIAPATGETIGEVPVMSADEVKAAVKKARSAQKAWAVVSVEERAERLLAFRDTIVDHADELVDLLSEETGKPKQEALAHELFTLVDSIGWTLKRAPSLLAPRELDMHLMKHRRGIVERVPRGVVGIISPWNFPLVIPFNGAVTALVTGSAVVIKPSEETSLIALRVKRLWDKSGLPEHLLQIVTGRGETGAALIASGVDKIVFTGAVHTGRRVAAACGERLIPCTLELGGKAPLIACRDADVERTAAAIAFGGFANSGQACISVERVYAHRDVYDALVDGVTERVKRLRQGDPASGSVDLGALTFARQAEIAERHVADALEKGAKLKLGGKRKPGPGCFFEPTVLAECTPEMSVMREEIFGPIVPFMSVESEEQAIELANDSPLGLNAYVFTRDREHGRRVAERISAGSVVVNDVLSNYACAEAPFGGMRDSGHGRVHGDEGILEMADVRHLNLERIRPPGRDPMGFPYSEKTFEFMLKMLKTLFTRKSVIGRLRSLL
jgi:succinate-semialdehyde dehydrogenase/glutarate-semialdehyde dehydrogenase